MKSIWRYKKITDVDNSWYSNKQLVKGSSLALTLLLLYGVNLTFINSHFELRSFNTYSVCLEGANAKNPKLLFNGLTVVLPVVIMVIAAGIVDLSCYFWLLKRDSSIERQRCLKNDIPLRATAISTSLHALFIVGFIILGRKKVQPIQKYLFAVVGARIGNILRNPLTAFFTFKINDATRQKNAAKERERKRQAEIREAGRQRKEKIQLKGR